MLGVFAFAFPLAFSIFSNVVYGCLASSNTWVLLGGHADGVFWLGTSSFLGGILIISDVEIFSLLFVFLWCMYFDSMTTLV